MSTINEVYDSSAPVSGGAPDGGQGEYIEGLKDDCGFIIPKIDWVVEKLTGFSLLEALLEKIAGDFNAVASMQKAWVQVGLALQQTGANYDALGQQLPTVLRGEAGTAAVDRMGSIGDMYADQSEAAGHLESQLGHILEVAQATAEVVTAAINFIDDIIQEVLADAAVPVLGWAKGAISAPGKAKKVITLINRGLDAIEKFTKAVKAAITALKYINAGLSVANTTLNFANTAASTAAGQHTDDTSERGFG